MNLRRAALLVIIIGIGSVGALLLPLREWSAQFEAYIRSLGALGPLLFAFAYMVLTVVLFPASVLTLGAGTLFGLKTGFFTALLGANLGALCSFLLARSFLRERVVRWTAAHPKFRFLDEAIGKQGFKMVLLCRLSPDFSIHPAELFSRPHVGAHRRLRSRKFIRHDPGKFCLCVYRRHRSRRRGRRRWNLLSIFINKP